MIHEAMDEASHEPNEVASQEPPFPQLGTLVDPEVLKRSGLDNPQKFTLRNESGVPTHYYVGLSFKDKKSQHEIRLIVSEERREAVVSGQSVYQVWRATLMPESVYRDEERREMAIQTAIDNQIRMRNDQIGELIGILIPKPPGKPINGSD